MMFLRLLKYNFIGMIRSKSGLFWTIAYPILLASLYMVAFSSLINFKQKSVNIGLLKDSSVKNILSSVKIFNIIELEKENVDSALQNKTIEGFIENDFSLRISKNGINQTIIKSVMEQIKQTIALGVPFNPASYKKNYVKNINEKNDAVMILFYSLLAMTSFYGMFGSLLIPLSMQANISLLGARISATPLNRFLAYLSGIVFYTVFNFVCNIIYSLFVLYVLKIPFITNVGLSLLLVFIANLFGVSLGVFIGSLPFGNEESKSIFCVFSSLFLAFLSGMMSVDIKIAIDKTVPIVNKINPIGLLTNNLYNINILNEASLLRLFMGVFLSFILFLLIIIFVNSKKVQYESL